MTACGGRRLIRLFSPSHLSGMRTNTTTLVALSPCPSPSLARWPTMRTQIRSSATLTRRTVLTGAIGAGAIGLVPAAPAAAHHGWGSFDTSRAFYVAGLLAGVRWGYPHSGARLVLERVALPANWPQRPLPPGANERDGRATMASARPYAGRHKELDLVLAGPDWMERWGLKRPLQNGERIEAVGFLNDGGEGDDLRPVMFWLADGQGVWQQLTAFPQPPEPAPRP